MTDTYDIGYTTNEGWRWDPSQFSDREFPTATEHELVNAFSAYSGEDALPLLDMYGVYTVPARHIRAVASVDLCEVVRETRKSLHEITGVLPGEAPYSYSKGTWFDADIIGDEAERFVVGTGVRVQMNDGKIEPVFNIEKIRDILISWRQSGVYVAANTSTLEGCELATITHTLDGTLQGAFDALLYPRNHDGRGAISKARALGTLATEAGLPIHHMTTAHIDDAPHHHDGFIDLRSHHGSLILAGPSSSGLERDKVDIVTDKPYETFEAVDAMFRAKGIVKS